MDGTELKTRVGIKIQNIIASISQEGLHRSFVHLFSVVGKEKKKKKKLNHYSEHVDLC